MTKPRTASKARFPFPFTKNGRTGKIYKLGSGRFKSYFLFGGEPKQNTFASFQAACDYLDGEFSKLDTDSANALSLNPLNGDVRAYSELEQLLRREGDGATLRDAVSFYLANFRTKKFEPRAVAQCIELFLKHQEANNVSPISLKTFKKHLTPFGRDFGTRNIHEILTREISSWLNDRKDKRTGESWSVNTRTKVRGSLVTLSIYAQKELKAIPDFGDTEFQKVRQPNADERAEVEIYTPEQLKKLLMAAVEHDLGMIPPLVTGNFCGLRPYEFHAEGLAPKRLPLEWEKFDWLHKQLNFKGQKIRSKSTREIPLQPVTLAWLEPFREQTGAIWKHTKAYDYRMQQLRNKAGVEGITDGYRHSYASYRYRQLEGNVATLAAELGNSPQEIADSYRRGVTAAQAKAWFGIMPPEGYAEKVTAYLALSKAA